MILRVPSSSDSSKYYVVNMFERTCTCPQFTMKRVECKHIILVETKNMNGELDFKKATEEDLAPKDAMTSKIRHLMSTPEARDILQSLEVFSRTRLSQNFIMRDFLYNNYDSVAGISNIPRDRDFVIKSGKALCENVLEPILTKWGKFWITFGYQCKAGLEMADPKMKDKPKGSSPHDWERGTYGKKIYCRVDIMPACVLDGEVSKKEFGEWCMDNLNIDLLMCWDKSDVFCITYSEYLPRRVFLKWVTYGAGDNGSNRIDIRGENWWTRTYPKLPLENRPKYHPSMSGGKMWHS